MQPADFAALLPFLIITAMSVVVMLLIAVVRSHRWTVGLTILGLTAAFISLFVSLRVAPIRSPCSFWSTGMPSSTSA